MLKIISDFLINEPKNIKIDKTKKKVYSILNSKNFKKYFEKRLKIEENN